ncbi:uncharacterized protein B0T15DRAFT_513912 [Chaetomium strumarium]|uniref:Serine hydrolase domain-containing protein n=1 Tax=Chaetomium strumarium TaxID=1170767 RepID=A0AAJ0GPK5_9PEZI|nr:hypothetical protein B0T15DRAFT_513912 [Chaetomium strumarium]
MFVCLGNRRDHTGIDIAALAGPGAGYFAYYDTEKPDTIIMAIDDLVEYVQSEEPFDGVLAFSHSRSRSGLGFSSVADRHSQKRQSKEEHLLRYCENALDCGRKPVITIPTVHLVGAQDKGLAECMKPVHLCCEDIGELFEHPGGHEIPISPVATEKMVATIQRGIKKALRAQ